MNLPILARRAIRIFAGGIAFLLATAAAQADGLPFGHPKVAYSGVTVTEIGGQAIRTRVYYTPGHQRNEMDSSVGLQVMLMDFDKHVAYMLMPMAKGYSEMPMGAHGMAGTAPDDESKGTVEHEVIGRETIDGEETTKYRFQVSTPGGSSNGFAWVTDDGILMRSESETTTGDADRTPGRMVTTLQELRVGPQDPALFELPSDYQKMQTN